MFQGQGLVWFYFVTLSSGGDCGNDIDDDDSIDNIDDDGNNIDDDIDDGDNIDEDDDNIDDDNDIMMMMIVIYNRPLPLTKV
jgi:hypothetical protein